MYHDLGLSREAAIEKLETCLASCNQCCHTLRESSRYPGCVRFRARAIQEDCRCALACLYTRRFIERDRYLVPFVNVRKIERCMGLPQTQWPLKPTATHEQERMQLGDHFTPLVTVWPPRMHTRPANHSPLQEWEDELVEKADAASAHTHDADMESLGTSDAASQATSQRSAETNQSHPGDGSLIMAFKSLTIREPLGSDPAGSGDASRAPGPSTTLMKSKTSTRKNTNSKQSEPPAADNRFETLSPSNALAADMVLVDHLAVPHSLAHHAPDGFRGGEEQPRAHKRQNKLGKLKAKIEGVLRGKLKAQGWI